MVLLEREPSLAAAAEYAADAARGHGRLVFVAGEAGVGKSAFVAAVAAGFAGANGLVVDQIFEVQEGA